MTEQDNIISLALEAGFMLSTGHGDGKLMPVSDSATLRKFAELVCANYPKLCDELDSVLVEARIHAQEARTANATIAEIYQVLTGATGEPGNWNGAEPARKIMAELAMVRGERDRLREAVEMNERVAQITAHRVCGNQEHDPLSGKLSGYCVVCQIPWPCKYAGTPPTQPQPENSP